MTAKEKMMLRQLEVAFKDTKSIPMHYIEKFRGVMEKAPVDALEAIIERRIRFMDTLANTELVRRGFRSRESCIDHAVNIICGGRE